MQNELGFVIIYARRVDAELLDTISSILTKISTLNFLVELVLPRILARQHTCGARWGAPLAGYACSGGTTRDIPSAGCCFCGSGVGQERR